MENEHTASSTGMPANAGGPSGTNGAAAGAIPTSPNDMDIGSLLSMAKSLLGGGDTLPEWVKWAIGAGAVGGALGVLLGGKQQARPYVRGVPVPIRTHVPDRLERLRALHGPDGREWPLGFFQSGIGSKTGAIDIISRPQIPFLGERLVIPASKAELFTLIDIKVGNRSQFANSTAIPPYIFTTGDVSSMKIKLDPADIGQDIALVVENVTEDPQTFQAALIGTAAQPCDACGGYGRSPRDLSRFPPPPPYHGEPC